MLRSSKYWWLWKEPVIMCGNWNVRQATSQQVLKVTILCANTCFQSFLRHWSTALSATLCWKSSHVVTRRFRNSSVLRIGTRHMRSCSMSQTRLSTGLRSLSAGHMSGLMNWGVHSAETRLRLEHDVLAHCLAGRQTSPQQCCGSLAVASASATRLGNTARWVFLQAQWRWGWYSRVWILQERVYGIPIREFQHSVAERNISDSQMKKFSILQGSAAKFFCCGG